MTKEESVPKKMQSRYDEIVTLSDTFCAQYLNEEYAQMCRTMAARLARKRPSPLLGGRAEIWAAGIVHCIGQVNFLFDKSQPPHIKPAQIAEGVKIGKSSSGNKAGEIRRIFNIGVMEPEWTLPSRMDTNPMAWYIMVNGFVMDARAMPLDIQITAYQKGLIPYVPALKKNHKEQGLNNLRGRDWRLETGLVSSLQSPAFY